MSYTYYPGCSLKGTAKPYEQSLVAVFEALGHDLKELADWNCCGYIAYMSVDQRQALLLAARNLSLAQKEGLHDLLTPCTACYTVLKRVDDFRTRYPQLTEQVLGTLSEAGLPYGGDVRVRHPLDVLVDDIGIDAIKERAQRSGEGLKVAMYYGCLYNRPKEITEETFFPTKLEDLFGALGVDVVDFPPRMKCCGGSLTSTVEEVAMRYVYLLLHEAKRQGAEMIATVCPLCQFNLEAYQGKVSARFEEDLRIPVVFFSQLLGYLLGVPEERLGLKQLFVSPAEAMARAGTAAETPAEVGAP
jgi:heterodisulfide reductase subunit B